MDLLHVNRSVEGGRLRILLRGELDVSTCHAFRTALDAAAAESGPVHIDIVELAFMDSTGLRMFLEANDELGDRLTISSSTRAVMRVFEVTHSVGVLPFEQTPAD